MGRLFRCFFRYAFHAAAGLSALALVAFAILWPRSYYRVDEGYYAGATQFVSVASWYGRLRLVWQPAHFTHPLFEVGSRPLDPRPLSPFAELDWSYAAWHTKSFVSLGWGLREAHTYLGIRVLRDPKGQYLQIPFSYLTLLAAILPACWLHGFLRRRRQARLARRGFPVELGAPAR